MLAYIQQVLVYQDMTIKRLEAIEARLKALEFLQRGGVSISGNVTVNDVVGGDKRMQDEVRGDKVQ